MFFSGVIEQAMFAVTEKSRSVILCNDTDPQLGKNKTLFTAGSTKVTRHFLV